MLENNDGLNFTEPSDKIIMRQVRINKVYPKQQRYNEKEVV